MLEKDIPGVQTALLSILHPRTRTKAHVGEMNGMLRLHVPIIIPEGGKCGLKVGDRVLNWTDEEFIVFDHSNEHSAWNDSNEIRVILIVDFLRELAFPWSAASKLAVFALTRTSYFKGAVDRIRQAGRGGSRSAWRPCLGNSRRMVDSVTHGLFGSLAGQSVTGRKIRRRTALVAGVSAFAPDLDLLATWFGDPLSALLLHRHFTHSLFLAPVIGITVAVLVMSMDRRSGFAHWRVTCIAGILGAATHGLLDVSTSYGTLWLWPFSNNRLAWDIVSDFDIFLLFFTFVAVLLSVTSFKNR